MFVKFVVLFALLCQVAFSSHLRFAEGTYEVSALEQLEEDNVHSAQLLKQLKHGHSPNPAFTKEGKQTESVGELGFSTDTNIYAGYYITRSRQNADCSGDISREEGVRLGLCYQFEGGTKSYKYRCRKAVQGTVAFQAIKYSSADCAAGTEYFYHDYHESGNECFFDPESVTTSGFDTRSAQCSTVVNPVLKPGVLLSYYQDSSCTTSPPAKYNNNPFDTCRMYLDYSASATEGVVDANTKFYYMKLASCSSTGKVLVHLYTDPACRRGKYKFTLNLPRDETSYNNCVYDTTKGMYSKTVCKND